MPEEKPKPTRVKIGQTVIHIYSRKSGAYVFRVYEAGKPRLVERAKLSEAKKEADRIARNIENGRVNAGGLTAADDLSYLHAVKQLEKLGESAPPLHVALAEYIAAKQLAGDVPLLDVVRGYFKVHPGAAGAAVPVADVVARFLVATADGARNPRYLRGLQSDLGAFAAFLPAERTLDQIDAESVAGYLRGLKVGPRRRDNVRNELVSLFRFAKTANLLPADRQTAPELVRRLGSSHEIKVYRADQVRQLLAHVQEEWIPWVVLAAFGGMRSTEIVGDPEDPKRPRLRWSDFRWDKGHIVVPASVAAKVKRPRRVPLRANLMAWLLPWRNATGHVYPEGADQSTETQRLRRATRKRPALELSNNALRHSYGTNRNAEISNAGQLAEEMGTSIAMIRKHYDAVPADIEPDDYFGIMPQTVGRKVIPVAFGA